MNSIPDAIEADKATRTRDRRQGFQLPHPDLVHQTTQEPAEKHTPGGSVDRTRWAWSQHRAYSFSGRAFKVLLALVDHSDPAGRCWPSQETLARHTSQSLATVKRAVKELLKAGAVTLEVSGSVNHKSNHYRLRGASERWTTQVSTLALATPLQRDIQVSERSPTGVNPDTSTGINPDTSTGVNPDTSTGVNVDTWNSTRESPREPVKENDDYYDSCIDKEPDRDKETTSAKADVAKKAAASASTNRGARPSKLKTILSDSEELRALFEESELLDLQSRFPHADLDVEMRNCLDWHNESKGGSKNWRVALRNWLGNVREPAQSGARPRDGPGAKRDGKLPTGVELPADYAAQLTGEPERDVHVYEKYRLESIRGSNRE